MFSKTDLVNALLRGLGNEQVETLDFPDVDTDIAITTVEEAIVEVLSQGWWFNIEENWKIATDLNGEIKVPKAAIDFRTAYLSRSIDLVKRSGKFYNKTDHTFDLRDVSSNGYVHFDLLMRLELDDIPAVAQQYIRQRAKTTYLTDMKSDQTSIQASSNEELRYLALLERQHTRNSKFNVYEHPRVQSVMASMSSVNSFAGNGGIINPLGGRES